MRQNIIFSFFIFFTFCSSVSGFEMKPICVQLPGANCEAAQTSHIEYRDDSNGCEVGTDYVLEGKHQPIHEAITRQAYKIAFNKDLKQPNYLQPLLSGVEWNDDPEQLVRKLYYNDGISSILKFNKIMKEQVNKNRISIRSHFGDMQFLHAMSPVGMNDPAELKRVIYEWIKNTYKVARGDITFDTPIKNTYFSKYFTDDDGQISDIFNPRDMFWKKAFATKRIASGSILHIIQDSYSASHVKRKNGNFDVVEFYTYPNADHCHSDTGSLKNKKNIQKAIDMSAEYLKLKDKDENGADWCAEMSPLIKSIFNIKNISDDSCTA